MMNMSDKFQLAADSVAFYMNGSIHEEDLENKLSQIFVSLGTDPGEYEQQIEFNKENADQSNAAVGVPVPNEKIFNTDIVIRRTSGHAGVEKPFGVRVYPIYRDNESDMYTLTEKLVHSKSSEEFSNAWMDYKYWEVEIDSEIMNPMNGFNPYEVTAMMMFDVLNTVYTTDVADLLYDSFTNNFMKASIYEQNEITTLHRLYIIPIITACCCKTWFTISKKDKNDVQYPTVIKNYDSELLDEYREYLLNALGKIVRKFGSDILQNDEEKILKIDTDIRWANGFAHDFVKRKCYLKDDLIARSMRSNSTAIRHVYMSLLNFLGVTLHEKYTGFLIESWSSNIFDKSDLMECYTFSFDVKNKNAVAFESLSTIADRKAKVAIENLNFIKPKLPSEKDIDLCFVKVDQMTSQADRRWVLDSIYQLEGMINRFESFYQDDDSVMKRYYDTIVRMRKRLDKCRGEVLEHRSFNKSYKVFVEVPDGYEG